MSEPEPVLIKIQDVDYVYVDEEHIVKVALLLEFVAANPEAFALFRKRREWH